MLYLCCTQYKEELTTYYYRHNKNDKSRCSGGF
jgi:hypothetical protein